MKEAFVGFDSAWAGNKAGAIAYAIFQDEKLEKAPPPCLADFADAAGIIEDLQGECDDVLVAIDQPIIIPNCAGSRPVDLVVRSFMGKLGSAAQSAARHGKGNQAAMFGDNAPVWKFINRITPLSMTCQDLRDFGVAKNAAQKTRLIEVYPALALPSLKGIFMDRKSAARYDPDSNSKNHPFSLDDWQLVCQTVESYADAINLRPLSRWARKMVKPWDSPKTPKKFHQDKVDAALCLLIAMQWRQRSNGVCVIGDLENGYIVTPTSDSTREILQATSDSLGVCFYSADENDRPRCPATPHVPTFGELLLEIPQDDQEFERLPISGR